MTRRSETVLAALAVIGGTGLVVGALVAPRDVGLSYLVAYTHVFTTVMGMLMLTAMGHLTRSRWFVLVRRVAEAVIGTLPVLAVLFVPVLFSLTSIYGWHDPAGLEPHERAAVHARGAFQTAPAFVARSIAYLATTAIAGEALIGLSRRQERLDPARASAAMRLASPLVLAVAAIVLTAATFDWVMSVEPGFYSDMFGVYAFAGGFVAALAVLVLGAGIAARRGALPAALGARHFHAIGTLVFAFVVFWMYIAFAQFMLGYVADLPHEARHYLARTRGGYLGYVLALVIGHFVVPFVLLLFRSVKERVRPLAGVCGLLVLAHYADVHLMLTPAARPDGPELTALDVAAFVAVGSAAALVALIRFRRLPPVPSRDPYLEEALVYRGVP